MRPAFDGMGEAAPGSVVIVSAFHDYRTKRRASIQALADALVRDGHDVAFLSTRFSWLSRLTGDSRLFLWDRANREETVAGVRCFLWRTPLHPFHAANPALRAAMDALFPLYARWPSRDVDRLFRAADTVIVESSVAAIYLARIRRLAPGARLIYYATDRLDTVGAAGFVGRELARTGHLVDHVCVRSPRMVSEFGWARDRVFLAEFGIDERDFAAIGPSPYGPGRHAVSVGAMLFDPTFFTDVAPSFPDVEFHVIGCGQTFPAPPNVRIHPEMPFRDTLPFIKHATVGIAPYRPAPGAEYLAESSLKLAQYEYLGLPSVCPFFAVGTNASRFGYEPGDPDSGRAAMTAALAVSGTLPTRRFLSWDEVARRVVRPDLYPDTRLAA